MEQSAPAFKDFINPDELISQFGLKENMVVSDFGIGSGYFTILMAKAVGEDGKVNAFDVLEPALDVARAKAEIQGLENIDFKRVNLETFKGTKLEDGSQDFVLIANVLFQSKLKQEILKEALRVLKQGGKLAVIDWKKGLNSLGGPPEELRSDPGEIRDIALNVGFNFESDFSAGEYHFGLKFYK